MNYGRQRKAYSNMKQKSLSNWLKIIFAGVAVCMAVVYCYLLPVWGRECFNTSFFYTEDSAWFTPWLIVTLITAVPCCIAIVLGWRIAIEIGRDNSFSETNSKLLMNISFLAALDAGYYFVANIVLLIIGMNHPAVFFLVIMVCFAGVAISGVSAALSHLVYKAAKINEENELTI